MELKETPGTLNCYEIHGLTSGKLLALKHALMFQRDARQLTQTGYDLLVFLETELDKIFVG